MTTNPSVERQTKDQAAVVIEPDFGMQMHAFWTRNRAGVWTFVVVVLLAVIGREGWNYFNAQRERGIQEEYSRASESPEKLAAFAAEYSSHPLAGIAWLRLADRQYAAHDFKSATTSYQRAASSLTDSALKTRARLGAAMALIGGGDLAGGEAALKPLTTDTAADKVIRAEACYHLATLANDAGRADEVRQLTDEITKIDPMSSWAQRAYALRASSAVDALPAPALSLTPGK